MKIYSCKIIEDGNYLLSIMHSILKKLREGTGVERLAIISDIVGLVGVSFFTLISGPIVQKILGLNLFELAAFGIYILMWIAIFVLVIGIFQKYIVYYVSKLPNGRLIVVIVYFIFLLVALGMGGVIYELSKKL